MLPVITELEFDTELLTEDLPPIGKSFLYDFDLGDFVMLDGKLIEVYGIDSLKMWIMKVLKTEQDRFKIYEDTAYGTGIESLIGSNLPRMFIESEVEREVTETLLINPYIQTIDGWEFVRDGKHMRVKFNVNTTEGTFSLGVNI